MPSALDLDAWQFVASSEGAGLLAGAGAIDAGDVAGVARLRNQFPREQVHAALELCIARRKAVTKFGLAKASAIVADPVGVEMASSAASAAWKARRFREYATRTGNARVLDLCCGVGGDAMALGEAGLDVLAIDSDPVRSWMASINARSTSLVLDAATLVRHDVLPEPWRGAPLHIDPARRELAPGTPGKRLRGLEDLVPSCEVVRSICKLHPHGALKLAPGVDFAQLAAMLPSGEVELISEQGRLTQAIVWTVDLAGPHSRSATLLPRGTTLSGPPDQPGKVPVREIGRYIYDVDDAAERAELLSTLCEQLSLAMAHPRVGLMTGDDLLQSPWLTPFEVLDVGKWSERRAVDVLRNHRARYVEVKTRDKLVNPDVVQPALQRQLATARTGADAVNSASDATLTLFVLRFGSAVRAIVAQRVRE